MRKAVQRIGEEVQGGKLIVEGDRLPGAPDRSKQKQLKPC